MVVRVGSGAERVIMWPAPSATRKGRLGRKMDQQRQSEESGSKGGIFDGLTGGRTGGFNDLTEKKKQNEGGLFSGITGGQTGGVKDLVGKENDGADKGNEGGIFSGIRGGETGEVQELTEGDDGKQGGGFRNLSGGEVGGLNDVTQEGNTPGGKAKFMQGLTGEGKGTEDSRPARSELRRYASRDARLQRMPSLVVHQPLSFAETLVEGSSQGATHFKVPKPTIYGL
ncbi:hypothetical protein KFL_002340090 [Klebsormidium nitens]|uniref:Uncharacterized protein n=1 Tax=Klebsormidium nitens TaxID=105231 RepID=A0A1Y1I7L4_KLENI|nr:hypothetical protein KFL_002340090 [Klebsormidium nitens]|eukprot:GAQ85419.1 hypothetical protein KFL_002340090 [Klebsormidium nitens]